MKVSVGSSANLDHLPASRYHKDRSGVAHSHAAGVDRMAVHFVYRSHCEGPACKTVRQLEAESVLAWFQGVWLAASKAEDAAAWVKETLGCAVYGLDALFEKARERRLPPPESEAQLAKYLRDYLSFDGELLTAPHCLQVLTEEEIELAYYIFDDVFLQDNPRSVTFLLREDWQLPDRFLNDWFQSETPTRLLTPSGSGEGSVFLALLTFHEGALNLTDLNLPYRISGVRLPELGRWLALAKPDSEWPLELRLLRAQIEDEPKVGPEPLRAALQGCLPFPLVPLLGDAEWSRLGLGSLKEARISTASALDAHPEKQRPNKPKKSQIQVADHMAQLALHVGKSGKTDLYHRWIFFDDQWAAANKALANGLLRYARRWDVLSAV
jgi:hypothetical protein